MGQALSRIQARRKAQSQLSQLMERADRVLIIHYSCESFYDRADGTSPRITSIAVRSLESGQAVSFSIHQVAERQGLAVKAIEQAYDQLEHLMLDEFYDYVRLHGSDTWLHWNMRDSNYGFNAVAHRYQVLGGIPIKIDDAKLVDLSRLLYAMYGAAYIEHPRLQKLVEKNNLTHKDMLTGAQEADAFDQKEYVKLHQSTLRKVDVFESIAERANHGKLRVNSNLKDTFRDYPVALSEVLQNHWSNVIIGFVLTIIAFASVLTGILSLLLSYIENFIRYIF